MRPEGAPVTVIVPGTCGELVQGWYGPWEEAVLVSCPMARYSRVSVWLRPGPEIAGPGSHVKVRQAARLLLDTLGRPDLGATIRVRSQLLPGRGMASSTADVVGVLVGLAKALESPLTPAELARLACRIEPSDSTMFAGLAMLAYRSSGRAEVLGSVPPLPVLMFDTGETIDTLSFNTQLDLGAVRRLASRTQTALELLRQGLAANDIAAIGAAATLSATSYQPINANPLLPTALGWAGETGALGLVRAHSGSVFGLLYPPDRDLAEPARLLAPNFSGSITQTRMTGAGYFICHDRDSRHAPELPSTEAPAIDIGPSFEANQPHPETIGQ